MKICMIIPPKYGEQYVRREAKDASYSIDPFMPYTQPLHYALIQRELNDIEINIIDAQLDHLSNKEVLDKLDSINPDIVITYLSWTCIPHDRVLAESKYPTIAIILQQRIDQLEACEIYKLKNKYTLYKELEAPLIEALSEFQEKGKIEKANGLIVNNNGTYKLLAPPKAYHLSELPKPDFEAFRFSDYIKLREDISPDMRARTAHLSTMKNCPFGCSFCGSSNDGSKVEYQTAEQVVDQLKYLHDTYNINVFILSCNVFTTNKKRARKIAQGIIESGMKIKYSINDRVGNWDKDLADLLAKSGCYEVRCGVEAVDPKVQKVLNKPWDVEKLKEQFKIIHDAGIRVSTCFTTGVPGETKQSLDMNAKFISDIDADGFTTSPLFIMPASPLYYKLKSEKKLLTMDWHKYHELKELVYVNETYDNMEEILSAERYMKRKVYLYNMQRFDRGINYVFKNVAKYLATFDSLKKIVMSIIPKRTIGVLKDKLYYKQR